MSKEYFITYQQFGGGAQAIHNRVIGMHPSEWVDKMNSLQHMSCSSGKCTPSVSIGRYVILFYAEMPPVPQLTEPTKP